MKKLIINNKIEYLAEKAIKQGNNIKLIGVIDKEGNSIGNLTFPNISNMGEFRLEEGQEWDIDPETEKEQRIIDLEMAIAAILGGAM